MTAASPFTVEVSDLFHLYLIESHLFSDSAITQLCVSFRPRESVSYFLESRFYFSLCVCVRDLAYCVYLLSYMECVHCACMVLNSGSDEAVSARLKVCVRV